MYDDAHHYRAEWMSDDQWECALFFARVVGGFHHLHGDFKRCGLGIKIHDRSRSWATWDFNNLTKLVVWGHDEMIRVEVIPSGPNMVGFALWKRHSREGNMGERHPTIETAIEMLRP